jgi:copper chaperone CopZ
MKIETMKRLLSYATALMLFFACNSKEPVQQDAIASEIRYEKINISGMSCTGCEETITTGITALEGVQEARADYVQGAAWITYDAARLDHDQLTHAIESRGYKVIGFGPFEADSTTTF